MSNTQLANVNEIAFTLACKYGPFTYNLSTAASGKLSLRGVQPPAVAQDPLVASLAAEVAGIRDTALKKVLIKIEQAKAGAASFIVWLKAGAARQPPLPPGFPADYWGQRLEILPGAVGWTDTKAKFEEFLAAGKALDVKAIKGCDPVIAHNDNPADTLVVVRDAAGQKRFLGISLKATFSMGDLTIFNGGVCATIACVINGVDVAQKKSVCSRKNKASQRALWRQVEQCMQPYTTFKATHGITDKDQWEELKAASPELETQKLGALSGIRDGLYELLAERLQIGEELSDDGACLGPQAVANVPRRQALLILGGILQFTHDNITDGACSIPYVKLTGFLKTSNSGKYIKALGTDGGTKAQVSNDTLTRIDPPDLRLWVDPNATHVQIAIRKAGTVSTILTIGTNPNAPEFNIRVKLESRPPSAVKIDICPLHHHGGGKATAAKSSSRKRSSTGKVSSKTEGKVDSGKASSSRKKGKSTSSGKANRSAAASSAAASSAADLSARVRLPRDGTGSYDHKANTIPMMKGEIMRLRGVLGQTGRGTEHLDQIRSKMKKGKINDILQEHERQYGHIDDHQGGAMTARAAQSVEFQYPPQSRKIQNIVETFGLNLMNTVLLQNIWEGLTCEKPPVGSDEEVVEGKEDSDADAKADCSFDDADLDEQLALICAAIGEKAHDLFMSQQLTRSQIAVKTNELNCLYGLWSALDCRDPRGATEKLWANFYSRVGEQPDCTGDEEGGGCVISGGSRKRKYTRKRGRAGHFIHSYMTKELEKDNKSLKRKLQQLGITRKNPRKMKSVLVEYGPDLQAYERTGQKYRVRRKQEGGWWSSKGKSCIPGIPHLLSGCPGGLKCVRSGWGIGPFSQGKCVVGGGKKKKTRGRRRKRGRRTRRK